MTAAHALGENMYDCIRDIFERIPALSLLKGFFRDAAMEEMQRIMESHVEPQEGLYEEAAD